MSLFGKKEKKEIETLKRKLDTANKKLDATNKKLDATNKKLDTTEKKLKKSNKENQKLVNLCNEKDSFFQEMISDGLRHGSPLAGKHMADRKKYLNGK